MRRESGMPSDIENVFSKNSSWPRVKKILTACRKEGLSVLAGGAVRDALMGVIPKDFDIATELSPEKLMNLFPFAKYVGKSFGVFHIPIKNSPGVEIALFRKDGPYLDGRHPSSVEFCGIEEDAQRRDFTINSLYYDSEKKEVLDFTGGLSDLKNKKIRSVGDPKKRFNEDKLRLIRAIRFASSLDFSFEEKTQKTLQDLMPQITSISKERVLDEIDKTFKTGCFKTTMFYFKKTNLIQAIFKTDFGKHPLWEIEGFSEKNPLFFWWCLFIAPQVLKDKNFLDFVLKKSFLCFSNKRASEIKGFFDFYFGMVNPDVSFGKKLQLLDQKNKFFYLEILRFIQKSLKRDENWEPLLTAYKSQSTTGTLEGSLPLPLVTGEDLMQAGVKQGPQISQILSKLYEDQLEGKLSSKKSALRQILKHSTN